MAEAAEEAARALADVVPRLARLIANALESDPDLSLSLRQYRMLERLADRPHRTTELATSSGVTQPTASAAVGSLEGRGLVRRAPDPEDRRATLIHVTPEGAAVLASARARVLERVLMITDGIGERDAHAVIELLPQLRAGIDRAWEEVKSQR
jgi:DNA-binding MarR family transcriptional regulator